MRRLVILVLSFFVMSGCAVGVKHDYSSPRPDLKVSKAASLIVGTQDRRPYVVNNDKGANFVGISRGGFGNTFDIGTASGGPLADDFSKVVVAALQQKGIRAELVKLQPNWDRKAVQQAVVKQAGGKSLLITLNQWKTDTYTHTLLVYDVSVEVLNAAGTVLARKALNGTDNLGGSAFNPPAHSRKAAPEAFKKKLEELLNDPTVISALQ